MSDPALVGDIGGTNARFALVERGNLEPREILRLSCADYPTLSAAIRDYLARVDLGEESLTQACLAFACPVHADLVRLTNNHWSFSKRAVKDELGLTSLKVINDFTAQALGVPHVRPEELHAIGGGQAIESAVKLVIGPGTGLGVAGVFPGQHGWIPLPTEGGHVTFAPTDEREANLLRYFRNRYGRVSVERILCGQGLLDLYGAHCSLKGAKPRYTTPAEVTDAANEGDDIAVDTVQRFLKILGDVSGDAALTLGAQGGVYLCGGILPRLLEWMPQSRFRDAFADKGRMSDYTADIPTWVVTAPWTGLLGAAEALHNEEVA
ncbi:MULTISPECIES: glucokinase [Halomonadaceae]|uniref:glucokinase n=1 Tax=Halomonadaceae TaxID=28256 RepID=UPI00159908FC|nr:MULTISPECIES: glucokinase [Halomonas]QJQ96080.1 glucokinase [Halomonas sp. PA5]